jgi:hypothetical protein
LRCRSQVLPPEHSTICQNHVNLLASPLCTSLQSGISPLPSTSSNNMIQSIKCLDTRP